MRKSEQFETIELGTTYQLPKFRVVDGVGIQKIIDIENSLIPLAHLEYYDTITFVRGDKRTVTEEEFKKAIEVLNHAAPYIGYVPFNGDNNTWHSGIIKYAMILSEESALRYLKEYTDAKEIIEQYLNPILRVDGILHEQLLGIMIEDLQYKSTLVSSREDALVITKLQEALFWLEERSRNRDKRNVEGTYKK